MALNVACNLPSSVTVSESCFQRRQHGVEAFPARDRSKAIRPQCIQAHLTKRENVRGAIVRGKRHSRNCRQIAQPEYAQGNSI